MPILTKLIKWFRMKLSRPTIELYHSVNPRTAFDCAEAVNRIKRRAALRQSRKAKVLKFLGK